MPLGGGNTHAHEHAAGEHHAHKHHANKPGEAHDTRKSEARLGMAEVATVVWPCQTCNISADGRITPESWRLYGKRKVISPAAPVALLKLHSGVTMSHQRQPRQESPPSQLGTAGSSGVYARVDHVPRRLGANHGTPQPSLAGAYAPLTDDRVAPELAGRNLDALLSSAPMEATLETCAGNARLLDAIASRIGRDASFVELRTSSEPSSDLAFARLESARNALVGRGVPTDRILVGATRPRSETGECDGPAGLPEGVRVRLIEVEES